ncbi:MAG: PKD domain-containing protein [Halobacteriaceae archaeon]
MSLLGDDRAQSVQVGAVILFGFLVVAMAGYQAQVVPAENKQVEFRHSERVIEGLSDLRNALLGAGVGSGAAPQSVPLGMRYPDRTFFVNPPPVSARLTTGPPQTVWINGTALADADANDAWSANASFSTRALVHRTDYHVSGDDPRNRIEHGLFYTQFDDANVTRTDQPIVSGNRLTLVTVNGTLTRSGTGATTVDPQRLSVSTTETTLTPNGTPTIFLPSELSAATWNETLSAQYDASPDGGADGRYVVDVRNATGGVVIELEPTTYRLRLARVGVGHATDDPRAAYVTPVEGQNATVAEGGAQQISLAVKDRFTNPVTGASLNATLVGTDSGAISTGADTRNRTGMLTDAAGRVSFTYRAPNVTGSTTKTVKIRVGLDHGPAALLGSGYDPRTPRNATVTVTVANSDGSGTGAGSGTGSNINPSAPGAVILQGATLSNTNCGGNTNCHVEVRLKNTDGNQTRQFDVARFNFYSVDRQSGGQGNQRNPPEAVRFHNTTGGGTQTLLSASSGGQYQPVTVSIGPGNTTGISLEFYQTSSLTTPFEVIQGDFFVMSVVFDNGQTATYFVAPTTGGTNQAPTADFTYSPSNPSAGQSVTFDASGSSDPEGDALTYEWDWTGDGTVDQTTSDPTDNATHSYASSGTYTASVTVSDGNGNSDTATTTVNVGGGGSTAASNVSYNNDAATFGTNNAGVELTVSNTGSQSVSVQNITIDTGAAARIFEANGDDTRTGREIRVNGSSYGYHEAGDNKPNKGSYNIGTTVTLSSTATISGGNTATITAYQFDSSGSGSNITPANMNGESITITLGFQDGSQKTFTATP